MKDNTDTTTTDMFGVKRGRGRQKTGTAKSTAERQAAYRERQGKSHLMVKLDRALVEGLDAQMQAIRDGGSAVVLTPEQAGEILLALRTAQTKQLRG